MTLGTNYCCIECARPLSTSNDHLVCANCGRRYPIVNRIPVLTRRPLNLLMSHWLSLQKSREQLELTRQRLTSTPSSAVLRRQREERSVDGMSRNLELAESVMAPLAEMSSLPDQSVDPIDWLLGQNAGWTLQHMLPYFYQDWSRTPDYESAEALILDTLRKWSPDGETLAVLGAGACGIVRAGSSHFAKTYGVDLSVPTLLLAQRLLAGESIEISVAPADWTTVRLAPQEPSINPIELLAADVRGLPFEDGTLSAVVTQYLMDVVGNPMRVASEISRVLSDSGVWVNLSIPFRMPEDPSESRPGVAELQLALEPLQLDLVEGCRRQFSLLNTEQINPGGHRRQHEVHFLVLRKRAGAGETASAARDEQLSAREGQSWWGQVPHFAAGASVKIDNSVVHDANGVVKRSALWINSTRIPCEPDIRTFYEQFFGHIDGTRTLKEVLDGLTTAGANVTDDSFFELVTYLTFQERALTMTCSNAIPV
jgi:SAM-dependent methyltransferase